MGVSKLQYSRRFCNWLFFIKATIALFLSLTTLIATISKHDIAWAMRLLASPAMQIPKGGAGCEFPNDIMGRLLPPPSEKVMLGFHLDWQKMDVLKINQLLGYTPAVINAFLQVDSTKTPPFSTNLFEWHAQECQRTGAILAITMEPSRFPTEIGSMPQSVIDLIADECLRVNTVYGTPIYLRYGHEMNGDWTNYGMQPNAFVTGFRRMATAIRARTNMTAMVWAPNVGINYPFKGGSVKPPIPGTLDFELLDTNKNGELELQDDPYTPYYPGDEYVDWMALSLYWYPDQGTGFNVEAPPRYFLDQITGQGESIQRMQPDANGLANRNFYNNFPLNHKKPMMIPETSAPFIPSVKNGKATNAQIKQNWWRQVFSAETLRDFPLIKLVVWFEETKSDGAEIRDWQVTNDGKTLASFIDDTNALNANSTLGFARNFRYKCNGQILQV